MMMIVLACLAYVLVPDTVAWLALVRAVHGIAFAAATTALLVAMVTAVKSLSRQRSIALANLAMPLSLAVFPVVAIELLDASLPNVAAGCAVIGLAGGAGYLFLGRAAAPYVAQQMPPASASSGVRKLPALLLGTAALLGAADAAALDYLPVLGTERSIDGYGWSFTVFAVGTAATLTFITAMRRTVPSARLVVAGGLLTAGALASWAWVGALVPLMLVVGAYGIGFAVAQTGVNTLVAEGSPPEEGKALAGVLLAFDLGRAIGVYVIGLLIDSFGFGAALVPLAVVLAIASLAGAGRRG